MTFSEISGSHVGDEIDGKDFMKVGAGAYTLQPWGRVGRR